MGLTAAERPKCLIVGAGLTGATAAWVLARSGWDVTVVDADKVAGGHCRSEWMHGVPYEPNGAHIFHTDDTEVWEIATAVTDFVPYEHRVLTSVGDRLMSWPIQLEELRGLDEWGVIQVELEQRPTQPDSTNFETWCVSTMGETLFDLFIRGYTEKQWGRPAAELSAEFAPKRVELRTDGVLGLFRDRFQGWPRHGYGTLVESLLAESAITFCSRVTAKDLDEFAPPSVPVILTAPLDDFFDGAEGDLEWRGVRLVPTWMPSTKLAQPCSVVNEPDPAVPYTRSIETKHVFPELADQPGTVVCHEYPGARAKHYPVYDARGINREAQHRYLERLLACDRMIVPAGRLARYAYINMDEAMRQGLNAAREVQASVR